MIEESGLFVQELRTGCEVLCGGSRGNRDGEATCVDTHCDVSEFLDV